jgi:methylmalonyl-CoA mutase
MPSRASRRFPLRLLTVVPICDGHDSAINTINLELVHHGVEVIYLGYHRSARDIVRAAIQEDVRAIGISTYNGGHVEFFREVLGLLRRNGAGDIGVFGGGGGTITPADVRLMERSGVGRIFSAGTPLGEAIDYVLKTYDGRRKVLGRFDAPAGLPSDRRLAQALTAVEADAFTLRSPPATRSTRVVGITGPGGVGKTTLLDELVLRFLRANPKVRLAILSHDPSLVKQGALLGDRATMIYSQDDRVFMRSLATRGRAGGVSAASKRCLQLLRRCGFDLVLVETVGIGQEAMPFERGSVDTSVLVMSPEYGSRLQLQKIVMLDVADLVVINKADLGPAKTAAAEIQHRLALNRRGQKLVCTVAKQHRDPGVDTLAQLLKP